jgi:3'(2'), 5'-bisphosphate nucleotidase
MEKIGSAYKFGLLAEGEIDVYPRLGPTMEWDIAAGQLIAEEAGCAVLNTGTRQPMSYNKPSLRNDFFIAARRDFFETAPMPFP